MMMMLDVNLSKRRLNPFRGEKEASTLVQPENTWNNIYITYKISYVFKQKSQELDGTKDEVKPPKRQPEVAERRREWRTYANRAVKGNKGRPTKS